MHIQFAAKEHSDRSSSYGGSALETAENSFPFI